MRLGARPKSINKSSEPRLRSKDWIAKPCPKRLTIPEVFEKYNKMPKLDVLKKHFLKGGPLSEEAALEIIREGTRLLGFEDNLIELEGPTVICGDIHGQFADLIELFRKAGNPRYKKYLFLGDYVDRGTTGMECILYLLALKITYPSTFFLLRGNHESRAQTKRYNFKSECHLKYSTRIYEACMESFDSMPLAALLDKVSFCVHGGLSPDIDTLSDILKINRFTEPPHSGPLRDLLWSDPAINFGSEKHSHKFVFNTKRRCSYFFSYSACRNFLKTNNLQRIIRAHELQKTGYSFHLRYPTDSLPKLITVFSAPNYCGVFGNMGAYLKVCCGRCKVQACMFRGVESQGVNPDYNALAMTLSFVVHSIVTVIIALLRICPDEELQDIDETNDDEIHELLNYSSTTDNLSRRRTRPKSFSLKEIRITRLRKFSSQVKAKFVKGLKYWKNVRESSDDDSDSLPSTSRKSVGGQTFEEFCNAYK